MLTISLACMEEGASGLDESGLARLKASFISLHRIGAVAIKALELALSLTAGR